MACTDKHNRMREWPLNEWALVSVACLATLPIVLGKQGRLPNILGGPHVSLVSQIIMAISIWTMAFIILEMVRPITRQFLVRKSIRHALVLVPLLSGLIGIGTNGKVLINVYREHQPRDYLSLVCTMGPMLPLVAGIIGTAALYIVHALVDTIYRNGKRGSDRKRCQDDL